MAAPATEARRGAFEEASAPACDGHHEMSDLAAGGEPVHRHTQVLSEITSASRQRERQHRAVLWMEKIMSKTNLESRKVREPKERELRDDELALVRGGAIRTAGWDLKQNAKMG